MNKSRNIMIAVSAAFAVAGLSACSPPGETVAPNGQVTGENVATFTKYANAVAADGETVNFYAPDAYDRTVVGDRGLGLIMVNSVQSAGEVLTKQFGFTPFANPNPGDADPRMDVKSPEGWECAIEDWRTRGTGDGVSFSCILPVEDAFAVK